ncbi:zinc finger MYM-type protein 1 [Anabrus simplex]|uniref:zinc finger MYM-type protein 1 n=1 Tax=Anabrus simplex TaxID=316456 RepID=UPI0035A34668
MANLVDDLLERPFSLRSLEEKMEVKRLGRPTPDLNITQKATGGEKRSEYTRKFNRKVYKNIWVCGCEIRNALFCFPCLLFGNSDAWCKGGVKNLGHLNALVKKHDENEKHMHNVLDLSFLGCVNLSPLLSHTCHDEKVKHNKQVEKNRYQLSKIIDSIKFNVAFELSLRGHDFIHTSENPGAIKGLIDLMSSIDNAVKVHMEDDQIFRDTSKSLKDELLDCMLEVCHDVITEEMNRSEYVAVMIDETTDSEKRQLALVFRYEKNGMPCERFWGLFDPVGQKADAITTILDLIQSTFKAAPHKIIALTYDGASVISGIQAKVRVLYPNVHYIHCYGHRLNLSVERAASQIQSARVFFLDLLGFKTFFSGPAERISTFQSVVVRRFPHATATAWNFQSRTMNVVNEFKPSLLECLSTLEKTSCSSTCNDSVELRRSLEDREFLFWLGFFYKVMPHVDRLQRLLQKRSVDAVKVNLAVLSFIQTINIIRSSIGKTDPLVTAAATPDCCKRRKLACEHTNAKEVCDRIVRDIKDRFLKLDHLEASKLMDFSKFDEYSCLFPLRELNITAQAYTMLEQRRLKTELSVLYQRSDFRNIEGAVPLLQFILTSSIQDTFPEITKLLRILVTTPMMTAEPERCFTSVDRIKTFLRNTIPHQGLSALAMLAVEKNLVANIEGFNSKVIDKFCSRKQRVDLVFRH